MTSPRPPSFDDLVGAGRRMVFVVGAYGSGKTEVSVNLALLAARSGRAVRIADLDLVNPYFRCREAQSLMEAHGVEVVVPPGEQAFADLPILLPEVWGMMHPRGEQLSLFDVGGDDVGARVLSTFRAVIRDGDYELLQVVNSRRPFSRTLEECRAAREAIEAASRLRVTGLVVNSHLLDETTPDVVREGFALGRQVTRESGIPVRCVAAMRSLLDRDPLEDVDAPVLPLDRHMLPPWVAGSGAQGLRRTPAPRPTPLGCAASHPMTPRTGGPDAQD